MASLKVMMIGFSGAGKTSYVGALYKLLNSRGPNYGFSLKVSGREAHKSLLNVGELIISHGVYPDATSIRDRYHFELLHSDEEILGFNLLDYRGGVLAERGNDELQTIVNQIVRADALIVFLDGSRFSHDSIGVIRQLNRIQTLIQQAISQSDNQYFVLSFVISKADCIASASDFNTSQAWQRFRQLTDMLNKNEKVRGLVSFTVVGPRCENVRFPFFHTMRYGLVNRMNNLIAACNDEIASMESHQDEGGIFDEIGTAIYNFFSSTTRTSHWDRAERARTRAIELGNKHEQLKAPLERIDKVIKKAAAANSGVPVWEF